MVDHAQGWQGLLLSPTVLDRQLGRGSRRDS